MLKMFISVWFSSRMGDPSNTLKKRNIKNVRRCDYNCAGYALECFSWYQFKNTGGTNQVRIKELLSDFDNIRKIKSLEDVEQDEYPIALRFSDGVDFHFIKRGKNGVWYEKRGGEYSIRVFPKEKIFSEAWHNSWWSDGYTGKVYLFAVKER